ncbi:zinc-dependent peptidase [Flavobacterium sp. MR2016-29]|uniref:zinc-dependent peptidase n=1 Tax=Flavobacterium sp. MR2016-29 TaxID=2783795 RepID=UPI001889F008|nr:zinc-dependent peptidase [Flavobacterium sp. MR2016-29]MBF4494636.1 zinc-dependent peptidase [Flavobacterium sp. MR2016-29]
MFLPLFLGALLVAVVLIIVFRIIEPAYLWMFNKPLYLFWYPILQRLEPLEQTILRREFQFYETLSEKKQGYFEHRVNSFIRRYNFSGKDIEVTQEMKLIIAGTYVMLTFGMRNYLLESFENIIIYPSSYYSVINKDYHKGEYNPRLKAIVFSWEDFISGHQTKDNINLGLHEFTHVLHFNSRKSSDPNAIIFFDEFTEIEKYFDDEKLKTQLQQKEYFREYAYTNKFEFLAVILENFFETPEVFKKEYPELFDRVRTMINYQNMI